MLNVKDATNEFIQRGADLSQIYQIGDYVVTAPEMHQALGLSPTTIHYQR